ncbi:MAG: hypothetical protein JSS27_05760 [Planctomycetes bacterium]|nr:hypothetical protein [Planctomycetota bacterium]
MTHRTLPVVVAAVMMLGASAGTAQAQDLARRIGIGSSCGYNAPVPVSYEHSAVGCRCHNGGYQMQSGLEFGCAGIPANWRVHAWDDYPNEPMAQRWGGGSLHPANPVPPPCRTVFKRGLSGPPALGAACQNCRPAASMPVMVQPSMPVDASPVESPPEVQTVKPSARRVSRDRST